MEWISQSTISSPLVFPRLCREQKDHKIRDTLRSFVTVPHSGDLLAFRSNRHHLQRLRAKSPTQTKPIPQPPRRIDKNGVWSTCQETKSRCCCQIPNCVPSPWAETRHLPESVRPGVPRTFCPVEYPLRVLQDISLFARRNARREEPNWRVPICLDHGG